MYEYSKKTEGVSGSKIILICVCIVLGIGAVVLGIIFGKVFLAEKKKKRARELIDEINNNNGDIISDNNDNINEKLVI